MSATAARSRRRAPTPTAGARSSARSTPGRTRRRAGSTAGSRSCSWRSRCSSSWSARSAITARPQTPRRCWACSRSPSGSPAGSGSTSARTRPASRADSLPRPAHGQLARSPGRLKWTPGRSSASCTSSRSRSSSAASAWSLVPVMRGTVMTRVRRWRGAFARSPSRARGGAAARVASAAADVDEASRGSSRSGASTGSATSRSRSDVLLAALLPDRRPVGDGGRRIRVEHDQLARCRARWRPRRSPQSAAHGARLDA